MAFFTAVKPAVRASSSRHTSTRTRTGRHGGRRRRGRHGGGHTSTRTRTGRGR